MTRIRQHNAAGEEQTHISHVYLNLSSLICLLLSALVLVGLIFRNIFQRHKHPLSVRTPLLTSSHIMSNPQGQEQKQEEEPNQKQEQQRSPPPPPPPPRPIFHPVEFDELIPNPLAKVYYPITSGQLAILAERKAAMLATQQTEAEASQELRSNDDTRVLQSRLDAYLQYFEDRGNGETWQRRPVFYKTASDRD